MVHLMMTPNKLLKNSFRAWNILPSAFLEICNRDFVEIKPSDEITDYGKISTWRSLFLPFVKQRSETHIDDNGIAHIEIKGTLFQNEAPYIVAALGGTSYEELIADLKYAETSAKGIFLKINSHGGHASGNSHVADLFAKTKLPVVVHTSDFCCSAAYAIASGANYIFSAPDTLVGSIGTILPLLDIAGLWDKLGIKPDYITNQDGILKASGMPPNQSSLEREALKLETESFFELFKTHVLKYRNIPSDAMQGQAFIGLKAIEKNLIDGIRDENAAYEKLHYLTRKQ